MSRGHDDFQTEPIRGLPERPPPGETILWQGAPDWRVLAKDVFHVRAVGLYFAVLVLWRASLRFAPGDLHSALIAVLSLLPIAAVALALLGFLAWVSSRTTVYTITSRRVVLRIGIALPVAINIPFQRIGAAALSEGTSGSGNIALSLLPGNRIAYAHLWPHVRPWRWKAPEPMLRGIPNAEAVASILAQALSAAAAGVAGPPASSANIRSETIGSRDIRAHRRLPGVATDPEWPSVECPNILTFNTVQFK